MEHSVVYHCSNKKIQKCIIFHAAWFTPLILSSPASSFFMKHEQKVPIADNVLPTKVETFELLQGQD